MMVDDLLVRIREAGGTLEPRDDRLRVRAPEPLPDTLLEELRAHKAEVLAYLQQRLASSLEPRIRLSRSEAELDALAEEIQTGFKSGHLTQAQAERLTYLMVDTARQMARGMVNVPVGTP